MDDARDRLAERFETHRGELHAVAYRMLGSSAEAEDAVQEAWLRLGRADAAEIGNLAGWLRTVVSRICLDMLRSRASRREDFVGERMPHGAEPDAGAVESGPESEVLLAESVGRALLVVLDALGPAERVAFVLHDGFAVPFDEIAPIVERSPAAAKKLASRARQRVRGRHPDRHGAPDGTSAGSAAELARNRRAVEAFLAAARDGDLGGLLEVLAPDVVRRVDPAALPPGVPPLSRGARTVAEETVVLGRPARFAEVALVDGSMGAVVAPRGRLRLALTFVVEGERIAGYEVIAEPARLRALDIALLDG
ncbi:sigma-70 family RNA polymerase sigma factor [Streptomyces boncukensis]|uniref:Sigma-70 family RNA polymerase sigma factor n=1 Tax=Streptomyces boncukensis TaxID=2711219 RepID=A0A6G4X3W5_9ACTN|nr:sigma-70 family RNA polymerase sigma factor [Streptomyces boncukensis]NGO72078.1 sigma-70 family RNA polymerase sigma factor [Streptomyces boncukensis]